MPNQETPAVLSRRRTIISGALLVALAIVAYLPALRNGFVWDDDSFLTKNPLIQASDGLRRLWFTTESPDYWPVTSTTLWIEWRLWGFHPFGYHLTNIALHALEGVLLWRILKRLGAPGAWLAAALFVVHPVNVESVAWVTQRKNLMAMLFFLLSILAFLKSEADVRRPKGDPGRQTVGLCYLLSVGAFVLALLSKGSVVFLPFVLLGIVVWSGKPSKTDIIRLIPFFIVAAVLGAANAWFQTHGVSASFRDLSAVARLCAAAGVVWFYAAKALWPVNLMFVYPVWRIDPSEIRWWLPLLALGGVSAGLWILRRRNPTSFAKPALFAWGYFCAALLPVMGLKDVYFMRYSPVADHYQHLAIIGVLALAAAGWSALSFRGKPIVTAVVLAALVAQTWGQCLTYRNSETLFEATLARNPDCWLARYNLGNLYYAQGRPAEAKRQLDLARSLNFDRADTDLALANVLQSVGRLPEAIDLYVEAIRGRPDLAEAHNNLGNALRETGRGAEALSEYNEALRLRPDYPQARCDLGVALARINRLTEAIVAYEEALRLKPDYPEAENDLGNALRKANRGAEAVSHYEKALRLKPAFPEAENDLAVALAESGRLAESLGHFEAAVRLNPNYAEAHQNLGVALQSLGRATEGEQQFGIAARLKAGATLDLP